MVGSTDDDLTRVLQAVGRGEGGSDEDLMRRIYAELRAIAGHQMKEVRGQTLQPTALVHEAYLRLLGRDAATWQNRRNFFFAVSRAMRDILVEKARRKLPRESGGKGFEYEDLSMAVEEPGIDVLALDEALARLREQHPRRADLVQLRFYGGLSTTEAAEILGVSRRTVEREWRFVRARLHLELSGEELPETP